MSITVYGINGQSYLIFFQKVLKGNSLNGNHLNQKISWDLQILKLILWHS